MAKMGRNECEYNFIGHEWMCGMCVSTIDVKVVKFDSFDHFCWIQHAHNNNMAREKKIRPKKVLFIRVYASS